MSNKKFHLFLTALILFGVSLVSLIAAVVIHLICGDGAVAASITAIASLFTAFAGIIAICLFGKGE